MANNKYSIETRHALALRKLKMDEDERYRRKGRKTLFKSFMMDEGLKLAAFGLTMDEIAKFWNIHRATLYRWAKKNSDFGDALKRARMQADLKVEESLYRRATGYKFKERYFENRNGNTVLVKEVEKTIAPDPTAIIFWLTNRQPEQWRHKREVALSAKEKLPLELILSTDGSTNSKQTKRAGAETNKALASPDKSPAKP